MERNQNNIVSLFNVNKHKQQRGLFLSAVP